MKRKETMEKNKDQSDEPCASAECEIEASTGEIHWIQCDECDNWFYSYCAGYRNISPQELDEVEKFICDVCEE